MADEKVKVFYVTHEVFKNQCYLIHKNKLGVLVDPAWNFDLINNYLIDNDIKLKAVLLTHGHDDHINLANRFSLFYDIPVYISDIEIDEYDLKIANLNGTFHLQQIKIGELHVIPILTPGHTLGSMCYLIGNHLFSGDTAFIEGVGICKKENAGQLYDSIKFLKHYVNKNTLIWPGHSFGESPGKDFRYICKHNIYFNFSTKENFVNFRMRKNRPNPLEFR